MLELSLYSSCTLTPKFRYFVFYTTAFWQNDLELGRDSTLLSLGMINVGGMDGTKVLQS